MQWKIALFVLILLTVSCSRFRGITNPSSLTPEQSNEARQTSSDLEAFFTRVLDRSDIEPTDFALDALQIWARMEASSATWNPLSARLQMTGSSDFDAAGIQNYPDRFTGIQATAETLALRRHSAIRDILKRERFDRQELAQALNTWGVEQERRASLINVWASSANPFVSVSNGVMELTNGDVLRYGIYKPGVNIQAEHYRDAGAIVATAVFQHLGFGTGICGKTQTNWCLGNRAYSGRSFGPKLREILKIEVPSAREFTDMLTAGKTIDDLPQAPLYGATIHQIEVLPYQNNPEAFARYDGQGALMWIPMLVKITVSTATEPNDMEVFTFRSMLNVGDGPMVAGGVISD